MMSSPGGEEELMSKAGGSHYDDPRTATTMRQQTEEEGEDESMNLMGESMVSLDAHFPPPETSRPSTAAWAAGNNAPPQSRGIRPNLKLIMNEQRAEQMVMDDNYYDNPPQPSYQQDSQQYHNSHGSISYNDEGDNYDYAYLQGKSEEEMLRIAMERSLSDLNIVNNSSSNRLPPQQQQQRPNMSSHKQLSQRSFVSVNSQDSDLVERIQKEADRTETYVDSPHTNNGSIDSKIVNNRNSSNLPQQKQRPNMSSHKQLSQRSFVSVNSQDSDLVQRIQLEADRTETYVDSPHTNDASVSSRRPLRRLHSWEENEGGASSMSRRMSSRDVRFPLRRQPSVDSSIGGGVSYSSPRRVVRRAASNPAIVAGSYNNTPLTRSRSTRTIPSTSPRHSPSSANNNTSPIRIGPLPKVMLRSSRSSSNKKLLTEGAEAVLEVARQNLSPEEVDLIEEALRKGSTSTTKKSSVGSPDFSGRVSPPNSCASLDRQPPSPYGNVQMPVDLERSASDGPIYRSPRRGRRPVLQGDSRHSATSESTSGSLHSHQSFKSDMQNTGSNHSSATGSDSGSSPSYHRHNAAAGVAPPEEISAYNPDAAPVDTASYDYNNLLPESNHLSTEELQQIEKALEEADQEAELRSLQIAYRIQEEEERRRQQITSPRQQQGKIRTITRAELEAEGRVGAFSTLGPPIVRHPMDKDGNVPLAAGYRMNASSQSSQQQAWIRRDQNSVIGPNNEVRTKHDIELNSASNAHRLGLEEDDDGRYANVGHKAYNSFMRSVRSKDNKGVAAHGTGRAGGKEAAGTASGGLDHKVRLQIGKAINSGLIEKCNGIVKEGKEAVVFHADKGPNSGGFDVAVKVFKRIQEFKGRGSYVDGDPRYARENFRKSSNREQLNLWTEKEYRNLMRAKNAGVPVPTPLLYRENILFMRFLGDGWPSPQLRELNYRHGSKKWESLYAQVMDSVRKLYMKGRLVHGDLSEYNILVVPSSQVENGLESDKESGAALGESGGGGEAAVPVLIDFGQAVDLRHPDAVILLQRDLERVGSFFSKRGVKPMEVADALSFVVGNEESNLNQRDLDA